MGLKIMVLIMSPFSPVGTLYFSVEGKYCTFKTWVQKVERIGRIGACIERVRRGSAFGYKARGKCTFPNMSAARDALMAYLMCSLMFCPYL